MSQPDPAPPGGTGSAQTVVVEGRGRRLPWSGRAPGRQVSPGRDFRYLWAAGLVSPLGDGVLVAALPLVAQRLTQDPRLISGVTFATTLPWLLLSLVGGALVDRSDRRRVMLGAQLTQAVLVGAIAVVVTTGTTEIWMLYALPFAIASAEVLFTTANQTVVPVLVPEEFLERANGRLVAGQQVTRQFAGPPLGSALFALALPLPFWANTVTFLVSVVLISRIRAGRGRPAGHAGRRGLGADIREGLGFLLRQRLLRTLALLAGASLFCEYLALSTLVLFAHRVLHVGDRGYGVLLAAMAVGGVVGGAVSGWVLARLGARTAAIVSQASCAAIWLAIGLVGRSPVVLVALFTVYSVNVSLWIVLVQSVRQRLVPDRLLGRVSGASRMITWGTMPLGSLAGGFLASAFGLIAPWIIGGSMSLLVTVIALPALLRWDT